MRKYIAATLFLTAVGYAIILLSAFTFLAITGSI